MTCALSAGERVAGDAGIKHPVPTAPAGVSVEYYSKLERGALGGVSASVLDALARALQLDDAERAHLFHLAHAADGTSAGMRPRRRPSKRGTPRPGLQWVLEKLTAPAIVRNGRMDLLATNHLGREKYGKIVTVASINGLVDRPDGSHAQYAAAKAAIVQYTRFLASDVGAYGIYANCLAPGLTVTDKNRGRYEGINLTDIVSNVAIGRLGQPEDQAEAMEFLVTDASDYVTGHVLNVSGGTRVAWWGPPPVRDKD